MKSKVLAGLAGLFLGFILYPANLGAEQVSRVLLNEQGKLEKSDIQLEDGTYLDIYQFEITTESPLFISLESESFDGYLILLDEAKKSLGKSSYLYDVNAGILLENAAVGKYEVGITSYDAGKVGDYKITVEAINEHQLIKLQADFFFYQGNFLAKKEQHQSFLYAIESYEKALANYQKINEQKGISISLYKIGSIYSKLGDKQKALEYYQQDLRLIQAMGDRRSESVTLNNIGLVYSNLGEKQKALEYYQKSLTLSQAVEDRRGEANTLNNIGQVYSDLGEKQQALKYYQQSLTLSQALGNRDGEATTLNNIGSVYSKLGEKKKALEYYQQALHLIQAMGDRRSESVTLNNIGSVYDDLGEKKKALEYYQKSLTLSQAVGDRSHEAVTLNNIGSVYSELGENQKALKYFQQALPLRVAVGDRSGEAITLSNIGSVYADLGENQKALEYYQQALPLRVAVGDRSGEAITLSNIGSVYADLGENQKALEYYQQALPLSQAVEDRSGEAITLNNIGRIYDDLGERQKALEYYQKSLTLSQAVGDRSHEADILSNIGALKLDEKQYSQSSDSLIKSINLSESINSKELDDNLKVSFFDTYSSKYLHLQNSLIFENKLNTALEIAERGRGRALVELLNKRLASNTEFIPTEKPTIAELKAIAKSHNSTFITYSLIPTRTSAGKWEDTQLYIYLITPQGDVEFRQVDLTANNVNLAQTIQAARKIITTRPDPSRGTNAPATYTLDNFSIGDYVKLQGEFPSDEPWRVVALNQANQTLTLDQKLREAPLENVSINRIASKTNTPLQQLHQILIDPIADLLPSDPEADIIFMPQDALFGVPFPALQDASGQYLIEKHTILTSPSIQVLSQTAKQNQRLAKQPQNPNKALIIGNPYPYPKNLASLENATNEAQAISNLLGVEPLLGKQATEAQVMAKLPQANILHFATHASFDDKNGLRSAIYLTLEPDAPDDDLFDTPGRITAEELFNQFEKNPLNAKIAVLSACDTGQGEITGDGVIGLSRSLIAAGVPSVIVSLWSVDDASTAQLMTEFYRQWQQQGADKATALRNAMLKTKANYPDPYYWSAFTLIGEAD